VRHSGNKANIPCRKPEHCPEVAAVRQRERLLYKTLCEQRMGSADPDGRNPLAESCFTATRLHNHRKAYYAGILTFEFRLVVLGVEFNIYALPTLCSA
jgi:hypothetical protein